MTILLLLLVIAALPGPRPADAGTIVVEFEPPTTNVDDSPLTDLLGYRLYVQANTAPACPSATFIGFAAPSQTPVPNATVTRSVSGLAFGTTFFVRVTAMDTSGNESACTAAVSGVAQRDISLNVASLDFGSAIVNTTVDREVMLTNDSTNSLTVTVSPSGRFTVVTPGTSFTVAAGATRTVTLRFTPNSISDFSANVNFSASGETIQLPVTGTGVGGDPDLTMTAVSAPATGAAGGTIAVSNTVRNLGAPTAVATNFHIGFFLAAGDNTPGAGTLIGTRTVMSLAGGVSLPATTTVTIPANTSAGTYFLSAVADFDNTVTTEGSETNNGLTAAQITITQPDLLVTSLTAPAQGSPGGTIQVPNSVRNAGSAAGAFRVAFFMSPTDDSPGAGVPIGFRDLASLAANTTSTATTTLTLPANASIGTYFLSAVADANGAVPETNEGNNGLTAPTQLMIGPDLIVSALSAPLTWVPGATLSIPNTIRNMGSAAGSFRVGFFIDQSNPPGSGILIGSRVITGLTAGASSAVSSMLPMPSNVSPGTYFLFARADHDDEVAEARENNNVLVSNIGVMVGPDLQMTALAAPIFGAPGGTIAVPNTVRNFGSTAGAFRVDFFISSSDATPGAGTNIGFRTLTGLAALTNSAATTTLTIPANTPPGVYFLSAVADPQQVVPESDGTNNGRTAPTTIVVGSDLQVTALTAPAVAGAGQVVAAPNTIRNNGAASAAFAVNFFISPTDNTPGAGQQVGTRTFTTLGANTAAPASSMITIPAGTPPGLYFFSAVVDTGAAISEANENNNGLTAPTQIAVGPDLLVTVLTAPAIAGPGQVISVPNTVRNTGSVAGPFRVEFFIAPAATPGSTTQIGFRDIATLAAAGTSAATTMLTLPALAPGFYLLSAVADSNSTAPIAELNEGNNALTAPTQIAVGPDFQIPILLGPLTASAGTQIAVGHTLRNTGSAAGASRVEFFISSTDNTPGAGASIGFRDVGPLAAGALSAGTTTLTVPLATVPGVYFLSAVADSSSPVPVAELNEANNGRTAPVQLTVGPDLQTTAITAPLFGAPGGTITVPNTVRNFGSAASSFNVAFFINTASNTPGTGTQIGTRTIASLPPLGTSTVSSLLTIPAGTPPGVYFLSAVADSANSQIELSEVNNGRTAPTQVVVGPDLSITALTHPAFAASGATIALNSTVRNAGSAIAAPGYSVRFTISPTAVALTGTPITQTRTVITHAANSTLAATTMVTLPALAPGRYFITALADSGFAISEASEANNTFVTTTQIVIGPDFTVSALTAPANAASGATVAVGNTATNVGSTTTNAFLVRIFLGTTNVPGTGTLLATRTVTMLTGGASSAATTSVVIPAGTTPGLYFLSAVADATGAIGEANETNNGLSRGIVIGPDLQISALTAPASGLPSGVVMVPNTVRNAGSVTSTPFQVRFFIHPTDNTPGAGTQIGSRTVTSLAAGATSAATTAATIPNGTAFGRYFLSAVADGGLAVTEAVESNNGLTATTQIVVGPDLSVTAITAPAFGVVGGTISVPNTVRNLGAAVSIPFQVAFFMSSSSNTPGAGNQIGTRTLASLAAGATSAVSTTLTIPVGTTPGTYFLSARADSGLAVAEADETNNGLTAATQIVVGPDLTVTVLTAPATGGVGRTISVPNTVRNLGAAATSSQVAFFLSAGDGTPGAGTQIGSRTIGSLAANGTSATTTTLTIPAGTTPGTYFLSAVADNGAALTEIDEANNGLTAAVQIVISP